MKFRYAFIFLLALLSACSSTTRDYKGVYEASQDIDDITVPPGLDKPQTNSNDDLTRYGKHIKTYSGYEEQQNTQPVTRFAQNYKGMHFVRSGSLFWLEVADNGDRVWDDVRAFFTKLGFKFKVEQPRLGYLQTDWLENRVDIPTGYIAKMLGALYTSDLMDRYRIRLEWDAQKQITRVFITHQGLKQVAAGTENVDVITTRWVPREADPELEIEMLMRFMAFRGVDEKQAEQQIAEVKYQPLSDIKKQGETESLEINAPFSRAWRHVGIAMDRLGYQVEDKNRSAGVYYIHLPESFDIPKQGGLFGTLFTSTVRPTQLKYLLVLEDKGETTMVKVKPNGDVPADMASIRDKILNDIKSNIL